MTKHFCEEMKTAARLHEKGFSCKTEIKYVIYWQEACPISGYNEGRWILQDNYHIILTGIKNCPFCGKNLHDSIFEKFSFLNEDENER